MKSAVFAFFAAVAGLAALSGANAGSGQAMNATAVADHIFTHVDADKDGVMTRDEYAKGGLGKYGAEFSDFDIDQDGRVTRVEYHTVFVRFHGPARGQEI